MYVITGMRSLQSVLRVEISFVGSDMAFFFQHFWQKHRLHNLLNSKSYKLDFVKPLEVHCDQTVCPLIIDEENLNGIVQYSHLVGQISLIYLWCCHPIPSGVAILWFAFLSFLSSLIPIVDDTSVELD